MISNLSCLNSTAENKIPPEEHKNVQNGKQPFGENALGNFHVIITLSAANQH